jgi:hypothetical protein
MTTKNIRAVTYLPPQYHKQLRQYMKQQNLTESAAIVEIIKQFFDEPAEPDTELKAWVEAIISERLTETQTEIAQLKAQMEIMQQLLGEAMSGKTPRKSRNQLMGKPQLQPLTVENLAKRLGVNTNTVEQEVAIGNDHFHSWSQSKDMSRVAWEKRGALYHPLK